MSYRYTADYVKFRGKLIQSYTIGNGRQAILALPSFPHSGIIYAKMLEAYLGDYTIYTLDLPGWAGYSENLFLEEPLNMATYVEIVESIVSHYELKRFAVLGYSFGGSIAIRLAAKLSVQVTAMALVSPILFSSISKIDKRYNWLKLAKVLGKDHTFWLFTEYLFRRLKVRLESTFGSLMLAEYADRYRRRHPMTILRSVLMLFHSDATKYFEQIKGKFPVLVVSSDKEAHLFRQQAEKARRLLKDEVSYVISGDHDSFILDLKPQLAKQIVNFLKG